MLLLVLTSPREHLFPTLSVMINFRSTWLGQGVKYYYWMWTQWCVSGLISTWTSRLYKVFCPPQMHEHHPIWWGSENEKVKEGGICPFCFLTACWAGHWSSSLRLGFRPLPPVVLKCWDSDWNYITGFPGSPTSRRHIMEILSLYNHMGQFS